MHGDSEKQEARSREVSRANMRVLPVVKLSPGTPAQPLCSRAIKRKRHRGEGEGRVGDAYS